MKSFLGEGFTLRTWADHPEAQLLIVYHFKPPNLEEEEQNFREECLIFGYPSSNDDSEDSDVSAFFRGFLGVSSWQHRSAQSTCKV